MKNRNQISMAPSLLRWLNDQGWIPVTSSNKRSSDKKKRNKIIEAFI